MNKLFSTEFSTCHFSSIQPGETNSLTRPDMPPTCTMFHDFNIHVDNREQHTTQLLHDFEKCNWKYFSSGLVIFPEGVKYYLDLSYFLRSCSRCTKQTISICYSKAHSRFNLSRSKLCSLNSFYPARFKQTSQSARPNPCPLYTSSIVFNVMSAGQSWSWSCDHVIVSLELMKNLYINRAT